MYKVEENRCIYMENDKILGLVTYPYIKENVVNINHTYVDESLRGKKVATNLLLNTFEYLKKNKIKVICTCSYAVKWLEKHKEYSNLLYKEKSVSKIDIILSNLEKSNFRRSFHLKEKDIIYIKEKGIDKIKSHAYDFITKRLAPSFIANDGRQTPMKGHPVFISQHATATCCRGCLYKWHKIEKNKELSNEEIDYIVNIIMMWIQKEIKNYSK